MFCVIARSVGRSVDQALGRLKAPRGGLVANLALARKLAALYWRLMVQGMNYAEQGLPKYACERPRPNDVCCASWPKSTDWCFSPKQSDRDRFMGRWLPSAEFVCARRISPPPPHSALYLSPGMA